MYRPPYTTKLPYEKSYSFGEKKKKGQEAKQYKMQQSHLQHHNHFTVCKRGYSAWIAD